MSDFYRELDKREQQARIDRLVANRPENLHDYQGCVSSQKPDMPLLKLESRHSDYGEDAGGYSVLRFRGKWLGRVDDREVADELIAYIASLTDERDRQYEFNAGSIARIAALEAEAERLKAPVSHEEVIAFQARAGHSLGAMTYAAICNGVIAARSNPKQGEKA